MRIQGLLFFVVAMSVAADAPPPIQGKINKGQLQGRWTITSIRGNVVGYGRDEKGRVVRQVMWDEPYEIQEKGKVTFDGDRFVLVFADRRTEGKFQFDKNNPQAIDFLTDGENLKGIYSLERDTLKICWGNERPTQFSPKGHVSNRFMVLKRDNDNRGKDQKKQ